MNSFKKRPVTFENLRTGQKVSAKSIVSFCQKVGLENGCHRNHFSQVLSGKRTHHKYWAIPNRKEKFVFEDVFGNEYEGDNLLRFAKQNRLNYTKLRKLLDGELGIYHQLFPKGQNPVYQKPVDRIFTFKKDREKIKTTNRAKFAETVGVSKRNVYYHCSGFTSHCAGWTLTKIKVKRKKGKVLQRVAFGNP